MQLRQTFLCFLGVYTQHTCLRNHPPGSVAEGLKLVAAGFSGVRGLREGLVEEGSRGTVGKPGDEGDTNNTLHKNTCSTYTMFMRALDSFPNHIPVISQA